MHEFVLLACVLTKATQQVYQSSTNPLPNPNITIENPYNIAFCFSIRMTHITNLGIWTERILVLQQKRILIFDQYLDIGVSEIVANALKDGKGGIGTLRNTQDCVDLVLWVCLAETGSEAFVQTRIKAFHRPDDSHARYVVFFQSGDTCCWLWFAPIVPESLALSAFAQRLLC